MPFGHSKTTWGSKKVNNFCPPKNYLLFVFWGLQNLYKKTKMVPKKQGREFSKPYFRQGNSQNNLSTKNLLPSPSPQFSPTKKSQNFSIFSNSQIFSNFRKFSQICFLRICLKIVLSAARSVFENFFQKYVLKMSQIFWGTFSCKILKFWGFVLFCF